MIDSGITHEGIRVFLSDHAFQRLVERVYGETTRDMLEPTRRLLSGATLGRVKPAYANEGEGKVACWLVYDEAGVSFTMPCYAGHNGSHGYYIVATTVLTPTYKRRPRKQRAPGRKTPKRKQKIGGRGRARPAIRDRAA